MEKEEARLKRKYGSNHPRVRKITDRLAYDKGAFKELDVEVERSEIHVADFDLDTWMVHGRVTNAAHKSIQGVTVSLYDNRGRWDRQFGHACTDARGYFAIRYRPENRKIEIGKDKELYLTVTDAKCKLLHRESEPVDPTIGQIDFRNIMITGSVCVPPETGDAKDKSSAR